MPDVRRYEVPLADINQALEYALHQVEQGRNGSLAGCKTRLDHRNRQIVNAVEEILNVVIPSLQGAAAVLEDAVINSSSPPDEKGVAGQVQALKKSIATAVRELHKALDMKNFDSPKPADLLQIDPSTTPGEAMKPASSRMSATRAMASAKRHLQSLHLPERRNREGDAAPAMAARIAKTMNEVAFHTNLLTLNAAVESYRLEELHRRDREAPHFQESENLDDPGEDGASGGDFTMNPRDREMLAEFYS